MLMLSSLSNEAFSKAESFVLRQRIAQQQTRVDKLTQTFNQTSRKKQDITVQLTTAQAKLSNLNMECKHNTEVCQSKQEELNKLRDNEDALTKTYNQALQQCQEIKSKSEFKKNQLSDLAKNIQSIAEKTNDINKEILRLDNIMASPGPQPRYQTTGATCKNGHVNCPNLPLVVPGQTTLINQDEITVYEEKIKKLREDKIRLLERKGHLLQDDSALRKLHSELEYEVMNAQATYWQLEHTAQEKNHLLNANKLLQKQAEQIYQDALKTKEAVEKQFAATQNEVDQLKQALAVVENEFADQQNQQRAMEQELQRLIAQLENVESAARKAEEEARLEELARKELALEALARQELEQEKQTAVQSQLAGSMHTFFNSTAQVMNDAKQAVTQAQLLASGAVQTAGQNQAFDGMHTLFNGAVHIVNDVKHVLTEVRQLAKDVVQTAGDLWPLPAGTVVTAMFDGANGINKVILEQEPVHTGNLLVDKGNADVRSKQQRLTH